MKMNFLSKLFYIFFVLLGMQSAYAGNVAFTFLYESGIESMAYQNYSDANPQLIKSITTSATSSQLTVSFSGTFEDSNWEAQRFNNIYGLDSMGLDTTNTTADDTDIDTTGTLMINGNKVAQDFALAHEHKSRDWWIATNLGRRDDSGAAFNVAGADGNSYCFVENGTNYQIKVSAGACSSVYYPNDFSNAKSPHLSLVYGAPTASGYGTPVGSLQFNFNQVYNDIHNGYNYFESIQSQDAYDKGNGLSSLKITVTSKLKADTGPLYSFQSMFNDTSKMLEANSIKVYMPENLDFWVQGTLIIDGTDQVNDFTIARGKVGVEDRWWIASSSGETNQYKMTTKNGYPTTVSAMTLMGRCFLIHDAAVTPFSTDDDYEFSVFEGSCESIPQLKPVN